MCHISYVLCICFLFRCIPKSVTVSENQILTSIMRPQYLVGSSNIYECFKYQPKFWNKTKVLPSIPLKVKTQQSLVLKSSYLQSCEWILWIYMLCSLYIKFYFMCFIVCDQSWFYKQKNPWFEISNLQNLWNSVHTVLEISVMEKW